MSVESLFSDLEMFFQGRWRLQGRTRRGPKLIKSLIADCTYSMWDSCRRGCVPCCLKRDWLLVIPGICCPSPAHFYGPCLSHQRPVVFPIYMQWIRVNLPSMLRLNCSCVFRSQICARHTFSYKQVIKPTRYPPAEPFCFSAQLLRQNSEGLFSNDFRQQTRLCRSLAPQLVFGFWPLGEFRQEVFEIYGNMSQFYCQRWSLRC